VRAGTRVISPAPTEVRNGAVPDRYLRQSLGMRWRNPGPAGEGHGYDGEVPRQHHPV